MGPLHLTSLQTMSYSALFTVHYWQGVSEGIGSRDELWARIDARQGDLERNRSDADPVDSRSRSEHRGMNP
jgi:hypothetical protein